VACLLGAAWPASARERLVVLVVAEQASELADDLTELVIANLAERRDRELVGMRELSGRLGEILPAEGLGACIETPACLARLGDAAGAAEALIAKVSRQGDGYLLDLALMDTRNARSEARAATAVAPGFPQLVIALRASIDELFAAKLQGARPLPAAVPVAALAFASPPAIATETVPPRSRPWRPYAGAVALGLAAVSFSAAAVTGTIGTQESTGSTRAMAQADLERRGGYTTVANGLLVAGTVLTAAACAAFVGWWRDARGR
jgi:predicted RNA-binding Zn ribbon-like protein